MDYEDAMATLLHSLDSNTDAHPMLREALETVLAGKRAVREDFAGKRRSVNPPEVLDK